MALYHATPLQHSTLLNARLGKKIYFKMECYQPTRSFKLRGMDELVRVATSKGKQQFVASSGGNAGYSLAYACKRYGAALKVFVPIPTPAHMVELIRGEGADVELVGQAWDDANMAALAYAEATGANYVSPFDDALLWQGHARMIAECAETIGEPDLVVLSVGGGGLLCGVLEGMAAVGWKNTEVLAVETEGAASYAAALAVGRPVEIDKIDTIARSLGARKVCDASIAWTQHYKIRSGLVKDVDALRACIDFADAFQVLVEPACGATLAAAFQRPELLGDAQRVLMIACGGATMDTQQLRLLSAKLGLH